ncbi:MAG: FlgD immunoglobulin-like domain containing protein [Candidatus Eisenbacteria bacterium]
MLDLRGVRVLLSLVLLPLTAQNVAAGSVSLFWSDTTLGTIERANVDGSDRQIVLSGLDYPEGLVVDRGADRIYWVDGVTSTLYEARLDGSDVVPLLSDLFNPAGLALDRDAGMFVWTNVATGGVWRANLDGTGAVEIANLAGHARGVAVDAFAAKVYVSGGQNTRLERMNYDGSGLEVVMDGLPTPVDVAIDGAAGHVYVATSGGVYRSELSGGQSQLVTMAGASGLALDPAAGRIYGSDLSGVIWSANLDGSDHEVLLSGGIERPRHLAQLRPDPSALPDPGEVVSKLAVSAHPNPFGAWTRLEFGDARNVVVTIHDATGRTVRTLEGPGAGGLLWDGRNERGESLPSGAYPFLARTVHGESSGTLMRIR